MIIDQLTQTVQVKICYFGPALSGKTTSIKTLFSHFGKEDRVLSIDNTVQRTLFFDYGTINFKNEEWNLKIHVYSTSGQDFYIITRPITMQGIDGIIFVADSQQETYSRNLTSWNELCNYFESAIIGAFILSLGTSKLIRLLKLAFTKIISILSGEEALVLRNKEKKNEDDS